MKESGTMHWADPNVGATNVSGFKGLPAGERTGQGIFMGINYAGGWWSSTVGKNQNWGRYIYSGGSEVENYDFFNPKRRGYSVRCLKD